MTRKEFIAGMKRIDPEASTAVDELADLFERDYLEAGRDLTDPATVADIRYSAETEMRRHQQKYDALLDKINAALRKAGATEAQINWELFGDVELSTVEYLRCNAMARRLTEHSYQITYCLGELKMLSKYADANIDVAELDRIKREYRRRFG